MRVNFAALGECSLKATHRVALVGVFTPLVYLGVQAVKVYRADDGGLNYFFDRVGDREVLIPMVSWVAIQFIGAVALTFTLALKGTADVTASRLAKVVPLFGVLSIALTIFWIYKGGYDIPSQGKQGGERTPFSTNRRMRRESDGTPPLGDRFRPSSTTLPPHQEIFSGQEQ